MINRRRPNSNVQRKNVQRLHDEALAVLKRRAPIQLRRRHPQLARRVDPHRVDPQQPRIPHQNGGRPVRRHRQDLLAVCVGDVDIAVGVDGGAARGGRVREGLDEGVQDGVGVHGGVVEGRVQKAGFDARHAAGAGLVVVVLPVRGDFVLVGVDIFEAAARAVEEGAFGRGGHEAAG